MSDTPKKYYRGCGCCQENPQSKFLNHPKVFSDVTGGMIDAAMQPLNVCDQFGCYIPPAYRRNCGTSANPIPCGLSGGPTYGNPTKAVNDFSTPNPLYTGRKGCVHPGWKRVAAQTRWPGMYGFLLGSCCATPVPPATLPPAPQVKYTTEEYTVIADYKNSAKVLVDSVAPEFDESGAYTGAHPGFDTGATFSEDSNLSSYKSSSVDANGNVLNGGTINSAYAAAMTYDPAMISLYAGYYTDPSYSQTYSSNCSDRAFVNGIPITGYGGGLELKEVIRAFPFYGIPTVSCSCGIITLAWQDPSQGNTTISGTLASVNAQLAAKVAAAAAACYAYNVGAAGDAPMYVFANTLSNCSWSVTALADDKIVVSGQGTADADSQVFAQDSSPAANWYLTNHTTEHFEFSVLVTYQLSQPVSMSDAINSGVGLLALFPLGDDQIHPWRTDDVVWQMPLVSCDAASNPPGFSTSTYTPAWAPLYDPGLTINTYSYVHTGTIDWGNPSTPTYSGAVRGAPQSVDNDRFFNFFQPVYTTACCTDNLVVNFNNWMCLGGFGETSPGNLPKTSTQWTDAYLGGFLYDGAQVQPDYAGGLLLVKTAEVLMDWPATNLERPFGRDRFLVDYSSITDPNPTAHCVGTGIASADYGGDIVTDPAQTIGGGTDTYWLHRRFPSCRAIGSTLAIAGAVQTSEFVVTITTSEPHWLMGGGGYTVRDSLDFYNVPGLGTAVAVLAATPGTNTFTISGTLSGTYSGGGYIASAGSTSAMAAWDSTCSQHNFISKEWNLTLRANGGYAYDQSLIALPPKSGFSILCCSPNTESFPSACAVYSAPFRGPANEVCPDNANTPWAWVSQFQQYTRDPFYQAPKQCTSDTGKILLTDPSCADNTTPPENIIYTDFAPLVEPLLTFPDGSPAAQSGITPPTTYDGGFPRMLNRNCAFPAGASQAPQIWTAYQLCTDWKVFTHDNCKP